MKLTLFFLFFSFCLWGDGNMHQLSQRAQAFWEAGDYGNASLLYEQLLSHSLPEWQQARLLYNLGTIRLAQHQIPEAIELFQKVHPSQLSLPRFGRDLLLNLGIAYLQHAQALDIPFLQQLYIEQSLKAFDQAAILDCQTQPEACHPDPFINQWKKTADQQLQAIYQKKKESWQKQASRAEMVANLTFTNRTSLLILESAVEQAKQALYVFLLAQLNAGEKEQMQGAVKQQQVVLTHAAPFIPTVLREEEKSFQQANSPAAACQQFPWDQAIPLFDRGWQAAQEAKRELGKNELNPLLIAFRQKQTIKEWQQVISLLKQPPQQSSLAPSAGESSQPLNETFRLIQEMYLQDQSQPIQLDQELHSW